MRKIAALAAFAVAATTLALVGTPTATADRPEKKVPICHATGSDKNPYVLIRVDPNGYNGHDRHDGDLIPAPGGTCPSSPPTPTPSPSPTDTPTESPSPSPTDTPTESPSPSPTDTPTESPSPSPTDTPTESPSPSPSDTPTVPGPSVPPVAPSTPPSDGPGTLEPPAPDVDPCDSTTAGRTATGFVKFKYWLRPKARVDLDTFIESVATGSCVKVYGFAGFNAKQGAQSISDKRAIAVATYLEQRGLQTVLILGLSKQDAADVLGSPLAHNRMVVLVA